MGRVEVRTCRGWEIACTYFIFGIWHDFPSELVGGGDIGIARPNLLAIVKDQSRKFSDQLVPLEMKRERITLERRLDVAYLKGWDGKVSRFHIPTEGCC